MKAPAVNPTPRLTPEDVPRQPEPSDDNTTIRVASQAPECILRFDSSTLSRCDEPVRRYFTHAITDGTPLEPRMKLEMKGRIKIGVWMPFTAQQDCDGSSFTWRAQVPRGLRCLMVTDTYHDGQASIDGRLLGAIHLFHSEDQNIVRAAAGRAATEGIVAPIGLLPGPTRAWRASSDNEIILDLTLPPERPALHLTIDNDGAVQSVNLQRWGDTGHKTFGYIPFGGDILAEQRFADFVLPSRLRVGWWQALTDSARSSKPKSPALHRTTTLKPPR